MMLMNANEYLETVEQVKQEIRTAQYRAAVQVNCELLRLYHAIGTVINAGAAGLLKTLPRISSCPFQR